MLYWNWGPMLKPKPSKLAPIPFTPIDALQSAFKPTLTLTGPKWPVTFAAENKIDRF